MKTRLLLFSATITLIAILLSGCSSMNLPSKTHTVSYPATVKTPEAIETAIAVGRDLGLPNPRNIDKDRGTFEFGFFGLHDMSLTGQVRVVTPGTIEVTFERGTPFASVDGISNKFKAELEKRLNPTASSPSTATK